MSSNDADSSRLEEIARDLIERIDGTNQRVDSLSALLESFNQRIDDTHRRMDLINDRLDETNGRLDNLEARAVLKSV